LCLGGGKGGREELLNENKPVREGKKSRRIAYHGGGEWLLVDAKEGKGPFVVEKKVEVLGGERKIKRGLRRQEKKSGSTPHGPTGGKKKKVAGWAGGWKNPKKKQESYRRKEGRGVFLSKIEEKGG